MNDPPLLAELNASPIGTIATMCFESYNATHVEKHARRWKLSRRAEGSRSSSPVGSPPPRAWAGATVRLHHDQVLRRHGGRPERIHRRRGGLWASGRL